MVHHEVRRGSEAEGKMRGRCRRADEVGVGGWAVGLAWGGVKKGGSRWRSQDRVEGH